MTDPGPTVLHVCTSTDRRGAEVFASHLVATLADVGVAGDLCALRPGTTDDRLDHPTLGSTSRGFGTLRALRRRIRRADLVVAHGSDTLLAVALASIGTGVPFTYLVIGDPDVWGSVRFGDLRVGRPLRRAAAVVVLWAGAGDAVVRRHRVPPARVHVIPNGRDATHLRPPTDAERRAARDALDDTGAAALVGVIGALSPEKAPLDAVDAIAAVPGTRALVAGDGPLRPEVQAALDRCGGRWLGTVDDVRAVLWGLDALVLASRTEGLPGVVVEAGLCGVPVVAPAVGGLAELVDATTGALVPAGASSAELGAALAEVLADARGRGAALRSRCAEGHDLASSTARWAGLVSDLTRS